MEVNIAHIQTEWKDGKAYKIPRIHRLSHLSRLVSGKIIAGSLPPSSNVTGVRCSVAATAT